MVSTTANCLPPLSQSSVRLKGRGWREINKIKRTLSTEIGISVNLPINLIFYIYIYIHINTHTHTHNIFFFSVTVGAAKAHFSA